MTQKRFRQCFKSIPESDPAPVVPQPFPRRLLTPLFFTVRGNQSLESRDRLPGCHLPLQGTSLLRLLFRQGSPPTSALGTGTRPHRDAHRPPRSGRIRPTVGTRQTYLWGGRYHVRRFLFYSRPFLAFKLSILCNLKYSGLLTPRRVLLTKNKQTSKRIYSRKE